MGECEIALSKLYSVPLNTVRDGDAVLKSAGVVSLEKGKVMNDAKRYNYSAVQLINCAEWIKNIA
jgi:F420-0:gamma-glutamyl ligase-like protein